MSTIIFEISRKEKPSKIEFEVWAHLRGLPLDRAEADERYESMETEWAYQTYLEFA